MRILYILSVLLFMSCAAASTGTNGSSTNALADGSIAAKTKGMQQFNGFFQYYYDSKKDHIYLVVDKWDKEFIYVNSLAAGVGSNDIGLDRNQLGNTRIVKFIRRGPKILMVQPNYDYRAVSDNALERKAVEDAFAKSVLDGFDLITEEDGKVLINITDFLLRDAHGVASRLRSRKQGSYSVNKSMSALYMDRTKNFPDNSEFEATITLTGSPSGWDIRSVTPTNEHVTVRMHHSFVRLPDDGYTPRKFDPRAGVIPMSYYDYATPISENLEKKFITRHRIQKKDPSAEVSEAVEPIVYYLDPGTPEPIRSALLEGASWWNQAFEAAGYRDGFQVKMLPEDADPLDVRYNMINWVHRSTRGWSYGSSVRDPRTGEIIKGHVLLGSLRVRQDFLIAEALLAPYEDGTTVPKEMQEMALARLRQLSAHEVGHTIGMAHNFASSTEGRASVMDYPHPLAKITDGKIDLSEAYDDKIGAWDKVTVAYAYQDFPEGTNEDEALNDIIVEALNNGLTFLTDQDARPQGGAHAYAHLWDNGKNPADELNRVLDVRALAMKNFGEKNIRNGETYSSLEEVLVPLYYFHRYQTEAAVKLIGGLNYRNALRGDGQLITEMVNADMQEKAMKALLETLSADHLALPETIIKQIPPRAYSEGRTRELVKIRTGLTFDPIGAAESAANMTLNLLFNPARAQRLVEYKARDNAQMGLDGMIDRLVSNTWKKTHGDNLNGEVGRLVDDLVLTHLFNLATSDDVTHQVKAIAMMKIQELDQWLSSARANANPQKAHYSYARIRIDQFMDEPGDFKLPSIPTPPDGSPIGCGE